MSDPAGESNDPGAASRAAARKGEEHRARFQRLLGAEVAEWPGWLLVAHPRLRWPLFNYAVPLAEPDPAGAARAAAWLEARDRLPCFLVTPAAGRWRPQGLALRERQVVLGLAPGAPAPAPQPLPPEARVWALPAGAEADWADLLLSALGVPAQLQPPLREAYAGMGQRLAPGERLHLYLAEWDGQPVGTGMLFLDGEGLAGLYGAAVLPPWRGRGLGRFLTRRRLEDAWRLGAREALVQTGPGTPVAALWRRLGARVWYGVEVYY
ncbi:MAG: GNAT family N-acetyltransferase [Firmicutes bacterium]|nr:GNAT family N-acetyltransferase [Bacillota bacterium]